MIKPVTKTSFSILMAAILSMIAVGIGVSKIKNQESAKSADRDSVPRNPQEEKQQLNRPDRSRDNDLAGNSGTSMREKPGSAAQTFHDERTKLMESRREIIKNLRHASPEERRMAMEQWHKENAEALAAQQQLAVQMSAESRPPMRRVPPTPMIPDDATPEHRELLTARHEARKDRVEMMNRLQDATPEERQKAMEQWHEENAATLAAQQQRSVQIATESQAPRRQIPAAPRFPDDATPEHREFLTARHEAMKDRAEMMNQLQDATPEERQQAMTQWHEKYTSRLSEAQKSSLSPDR